MDNDTREKIKQIIANIEDIQECILCSNFELMDKYIELFMMDYTKLYMDILEYSSKIDTKLDKSYWMNTTNEILLSVRSKNVFFIMDVLYFELREKLVQLVGLNG